MKKTFLILLILAVVVAIFFWGYFPTLTRYRELRTEQESIAAKIIELDQKIQDLDEERNLLENDREYIEKVIREELGLVKPGEVVYKFVQDKLPEPAQTPQLELNAEESANRDLTLI